MASVLILVKQLHIHHPLASSVSLWGGDKNSLPLISRNILLLLSGILFKVLCLLKVLRYWPHVCLANIHHHIILFVSYRVVHSLRRKKVCSGAPQFDCLCLLTTPLDICLTGVTPCSTFNFTDDGFTFSSTSSLTSLSICNALFSVEQNRFFTLFLH